MCTLSIYSSDKDCIITMNRDELRTRYESGVFNSQSNEQGKGIIFPVDDESQGTWIGVNNNGVVLCLLNHYQGQQCERMKSRGKIIPSALLQGTVESIEFFLRELDSELYNPFDLFLITQQYRVHFQWNGKIFKQSQLSLSPWYMFTSSSYLTNQVVSYRQSLFESWTKEVGEAISKPEEIINGFHFKKEQSLETHSVLMSRNHSHTKSIVQIQLGRENLNIDYYMVDNDASFLSKPISQGILLSS